MCVCVSICSVSFIKSLFLIQTKLMTSVIHSHLTIALNYAANSKCDNIFRPSVHVGCQALSSSISSLVAKATVHFFLSQLRLMHAHFLQQPPPTRQIQNIATLSFFSSRSCLFVCICSLFCALAVSALNPSWPRHS